MTERHTKYKGWWSLGEEDKWAEVSGTPLMPNQGPPDKGKRKPQITVKTAMTPCIPVANAFSDPPRQADLSEHWALPSLERYPLDTYEEVKTACAYIGQWMPRMALPHRREYCQNLVKRASQLGIEVSPLVRCYGGEGYGDEVDLCLEMREPLMRTDTQKEALASLRDVRPHTPPDIFCLALEELDKTAGIDTGWNNLVPDPYLSTYGVKTAQEHNELVMVGNEAIPKRAIIKGALTHRKSVVTTFGEELADELAKDPMGIFSSLPRDQKKMLMRMFTDNSPSPDITDSV